MLYWEQFPRNGISQAVRYGDWKAVRMQEDEAWQLFDLKKDPSEKNDVASENPKVLTKIENFTKSAHVESECWPVNF